MAEETKKVAAEAEEKPAKEEKAKKAEKPAKKAKSGKPGFFKRIGNFFKEYKSEMKKVVWYPRQEVVRDTGIVVASLTAAGILIGVLDLVFTQIILWLGQIG